MCFPFCPFPKVLSLCSWCRQLGAQPGLFPCLHSSDGFGPLSAGLSCMRSMSTEALLDLLYLHPLGGLSWYDWRNTATKWAKVLLLAIQETCLPFNIWTGWNNGNVLKSGTPSCFFESPQATPKSKTPSLSHLHKAVELQNPVESGGSRAGKEMTKAKHKSAQKWRIRKWWETDVAF